MCGIGVALAVYRKGILASPIPKRFETIRFRDAGLDGELSAPSRETQCLLNTDEKAHTECVHCSTSVTEDNNCGFEFWQ
jgi:hypothetical protein